MIARVGAVVVISGNKAGGDGVPVLSAGVKEEVQIVLNLGKPVIPIGVSGYVALALGSGRWKRRRSSCRGSRGLLSWPCLVIHTVTNEQIVSSMMVLLKRVEAGSSAKVTSRRSRAKTSTYTIVKADAFEDSTSHKGGKDLQGDKKWFLAFLQARGMDRAIGQMLFRYRATLAEYQELKERFSDRFAALGSSPWRFESNAEAALFVLYASEWWRREFAGGA